MNNEPILYKEKYWESQIPLLTEKAIKQYDNVSSGISERVRQQQKQAYEHRVYVKDLIRTDIKLQNF